MLIYSIFSITISKLNLTCICQTKPELHVQINLDMQLPFLSNILGIQMQ